MKTLLAPLLIAPLAACAIIPDTPISNGDAAPQGTAVALRQPVWTGDAILTPLQVVEDSRCPANARCVWPGKLTVSTRIAATHWTQTAPLTLGEPYEILGRTFVLTSGTPERTAERQTPETEYRLTYERR